MRKEDESRRPNNTRGITCMSDDQRLGLTMIIVPLRNIMTKEIFEGNVEAIKNNKIEMNDNLRVLASINKIVDRAFVSPAEIEDPELGEKFIENARFWYNTLKERYHGTSRECFVKGLLEEFGYDTEEIGIVKAITGKMEVEITICALLKNDVK